MDGLAYFALGLFPRLSLSWKIGGFNLQYDLTSELPFWLAVYAKSIFGS